jgi:hypothetical protein
VIRILIHDQFLVLRTYHFKLGLCLLIINYLVILSKDHEKRSLERLNVLGCQMLLLMDLKQIVDRILKMEVVVLLQLANEGLCLQVMDCAILHWSVGV